MQSPGGAGDWEAGNPAELFHHFKPSSCSKKNLKKNVFQDSVGLSDQKRRSGYTERQRVICFPPDLSSFSINQIWGGEEADGCPLGRNCSFVVDGV